MCLKSSPSFLVFCLVSGAGVVWFALFVVLCDIVKGEQRFVYISFVVLVKMHAFELGLKKISKKMMFRVKRFYYNEGLRYFTAGSGATR